MKTLRHLLPALATAALFASCTQQLPDVADFDRCYQRAEQLAQSEIQELDRRHSANQIDEQTYQQQKSAIQTRIGQRAVDIAFTNHSLATIQRANQGLPTPQNPLEISVPQAGTLSTGGDFRRFNDQTSSPSGTTGDTISGMGQMMTNSGFTPGAATQARSRSAY